MPTFLLGVLLHFLYFQLTLAGYQIFPAGGYVEFSRDPASWLNHMLLPWATLALVLAAT